METTLFIVAGLEAALGFATWLQNPGSREHRAFLGVALLTASWVTSNALIGIAPGPESALFWTRNTFIAFSFLPFFIYILSFYYIGERSALTGEKLLLAFFPCAVLFGLTRAGLVISDVTLGAEPQFTYGSLYPFLAVYLVYWVYPFARILRRYRSMPRIQQLRVKYLFGSMGATVVAGMSSNYLLPLLGRSDYYTVGPAFSFIFVLAVAYSMAQHRLFDIEVLIGPLVPTKKYRFHQGIRRVLPEIALGLRPEPLEETLETAFGSKSFSIASLDPSQHTQEIFAGNNALALKPDDRVLEPLIDGTENHVAIDELERAQDMDSLKAQGIYAVLPLRRASVLVGFFTLGTDLAQKFYSREDFTLLQALCVQLARAIENNRNLQMETASWKQSAKRLGESNRRLLADLHRLKNTRAAQQATSPPASEIGTTWRRGASLKELMQAYEIEVISNALKESGNNQKEAAKLLRIAPSTLNDKIEKYRIL